MGRICVSDVKRNFLVAIIAAILAIALCLTNVMIVCGIIAVVAFFNPWGIGENILLPSIIFVALVANELFINLKYNKTWIKSHTKEEIVARYGEFDANDHNSYYYKTVKINSTSFEAVRISFDEDGNVLEVDKDSVYHSPGG